MGVMTYLHNDKTRILVINFLYKNQQLSEAANQRYFTKYVFLKISQKSDKNICAGSFFK